MKIERTPVSVALGNGETYDGFYTNTDDLVTVESKFGTKSAKPGPEVKATAELLLAGILHDAKLAGKLTK